GGRYAAERRIPCDGALGHRRCRRTTAHISYFAFSLLVCRFRPMIGRRRNRRPVRCRRTREENMAKFLYIYHGSGKMPTDEASRKAAMDAWTDWYGKLGTARARRGHSVGLL